MSTPSTAAQDALYCEMGSCVLSSDWSIDHTHASDWLKPRCHIEARDVLEDETVQYTVQSTVQSTVQPQMTVRSRVPASACSQSLITSKTCIIWKTETHQQQNESPLGSLAILKTNNNEYSLNNIRMPCVSDANYLSSKYCCNKSPLDSYLILTASLSYICIENRLLHK